MQKANCCSPEIYSICKYSHGKKKSFSTQRNISPTQKPTPGAQKQQNRQKLLDRTNLNTCKLLINDNARFSTEIAKIYKGQNFKSIFSLVFARKPGWKSACHNPAGIVIWSKKTNKKTNMYYLLCRFYFRFQQMKRWNVKLKLFFSSSFFCKSHKHLTSSSDVFPRHIGGDEDQKKESNRVTYTCSIIKIHWIYSTGRNGWWQRGHIASVQMGSGVM